MGFMAVSYQFGEVLASLYAGLILSMGGSWRALFIIPGITLAVVGIQGARFLTNSPTDVGHELPQHSLALAGTPKAPAPEADQDTTYWQRFGLLLEIAPSY